jgi:hypothetical protein
MTDNDFNIIPAVESLQNVPGLTPAQQREQRKRRQNKPAPQHEPEAEPSEDDTENPRPMSGRDNAHSIDYRA